MRPRLTENSLGISNTGAVDDTSERAESLHCSVNGISHARFIRYLGLNEMDVWTKFCSKRFSTSAVQIGNYRASPQSRKGANTGGTQT
jgi:hypothetical protein